MMEGMIEIGVWIVSVVLNVSIGAESSEDCGMKV